MNRPAAILLPVILLLVSVAPAMAVNDNARIAVTIQAHTSKAQCTTNAPTAACVGFVTQGNLNIAYDLYVFVAQADVASGIAGAAFGIRYNNTAKAGLDIYQWTKCSDLEFPGQGWPQSGGGNTITFVTTPAPANCQRTERGTEGVHAVLGWFYCFAYGADTFEITNRNIAIPDMKVAACNAQETNLTGLNRGGRIAFSSGATTPGCNPCASRDGACIPTPVDRSTWGGIKKSYTGN